MNFLNQTAAQVRELFESMTPGARITAGLLLAIVVVSMGYLFQQSTARPDEYLFGAEPLSGSQINAMTAAMSQAGLNDFEIEGARIRVPRGERYAYIAAVANAGAMPVSAKDFMSAALDSGSFTDTRETRLQRIKLGVEKEMSHTIGLYPWVQQASVIYDVKPGRGLRAIDQASATVSILPKIGESLDSKKARDIKSFVAGAFTSMKPEDVTVTSLGGDDSYGVAGETDAEAYETPYHRERARVENEVRRDILGQLVHIPGVRVQVSAKLDDVMQQQVLEVKPDPQSVATEETSDEETITEKTVDEAGRPGLTINGPRGLGSEEPPQKVNSREISNVKTVTSSEVGSTQTQELRAGMSAKEIHASIAVPRDYVIGVWKQQQLLATGEAPDTVDPELLKGTIEQVIRDVQNTVKPLLPGQLGENDYQRVNVVVIDTLPTTPLPEPTLTAEALAWTSRHGTTLAMFGLALVSLVMMRSFLRSGPTNEPGAASASILQLGTDGATAAATSEGDEDEDEDSRPKLRFRKADSLKDDLSEIVREDPDAAAAILRSWIGKAA